MVGHPAADSNDRLMHFFKILSAQTDIIVCSGHPHPIQILKKVRQTAITICTGLVNPDGQYIPLWIYHGFFSRAEKPSEDITRRLFLMNMKGLKKHDLIRQVLLLTVQ
jgi:hypothetical protein